MLRSAAFYLSSLPPIFTDGLLYVLVAMFAFLQSQLGTDDAAKFISPTALWWAKTVVGTLAAGCLALKLFRSTAYSDHQKSKNGTQFFEKPQDPPKL